MPSKPDQMLSSFALVGACLLHVQLAERVLAKAVELVLRDRRFTATKFTEQTERERKRTLGDFLKELQKHVQVEREFKEKLWRFLKMRNTLVHNVHEVPGWDLNTEKGRAAAKAFLGELAMTGIAVTGVFMSLFSISAREEYGEELVKGDESKIMGELEKIFGLTARKLLAGRHWNPVPRPAKILKE